MSKSNLYDRLNELHKNNKCLFCQEPIDTKSIKHYFCYEHNTFPILKLSYFWWIMFETHNLIIEDDGCHISENGCDNRVPIKLEHLPDPEKIEQAIIDHYQKYVILT